jgi:two-component system, NtrC family, sensor kinase
MPMKKTKENRMRTRDLKSSIIWAFLAVILFLSISIGTLGFHIVMKGIIEKTQHQMTNHVKAAHLVYESDKESIGKSLGLITRFDDIEGLRKKASLDYLYLVGISDTGDMYSDIARKAMYGEEASGTRIISAEEIRKMGNDIAEMSDLEIIDTPRARPDSPKSLKSLMAIEYARPVYGESGDIKGVLYGGKIINRDNTLVDRIRDLVFEDKLYQSKPVGTVTIFQDDVRIATNVLTEKGDRALGTRVSGEVYENVVGKGKVWLDRAFVVTDWYLTAYEPVKDIDGNIIGILYVGMLEQPFSDMARNIFIAFLVIITGSVVLSVFISFMLAGAIVKPVRSVLDGIDKISNGHLEYRVRTDTAIKELDHLAASFNDMAEALDKGNKELVSSNSRREALNKRYLDLIGFVSHELKGILASTILNAYSVRDGFLGMVNFKQQKALDSITRNLDHLDATVKNFLNLSRIEKGEMALNKRPVLIKEEVFDTAIDTFNKQISEKGMEVRNTIQPDLVAEADRDLMQIVANNLISNAVKYGNSNGLISIKSAQVDRTKIRISVYNDGRVITDDEKKVLFDRFVRLASPETRKEKGTGLGLFIVREIVEKHGGGITVETGEKGNTFVFDIDKGGA